MQLVVNVEKQHLLFFLTSVVIVISIAYAVALDTSQAYHSVNQVDFSNPLTQDVTIDGELRLSTGRLIVSDDILSSCQICMRYADSNGRASASWRCESTENPVNTDLAGDVNSDDDFDIKITCSDSVVQSAFRLCRRYADANKRVEAKWRCADFGQELITDLVGDVNSDDDFDLVIAPKNSEMIITSCGICVRYADAGGRNDAAWRCAPIGKIVKTDLLGDVNADDDFDLKLTCKLYQAPETGETTNVFFED